MEDRKRWLILFREMVGEKILGDELDLKYPRSCFLSAIIGFREKYRFSLFSKFTYLLLVEEFIKVVDQNAFDLDLNHMRKELISRSSKQISPAVSWLTPKIIQGAKQADYRHRQMLGDDY